MTNRLVLSLGIAALVTATALASSPSKPVTDGGKKISRWLSWPRRRKEALTEKEHRKLIESILREHGHVFSEGDRDSRGGHSNIKEAEPAGSSLLVPRLVKILPDLVDLSPQEQKEKIGLFVRAYLKGFEMISNHRRRNEPLRPTDVKGALADLVSKRFEPLTKDEQLDLDQLIRWMTAGIDRATDAEFAASFSRLAALQEHVMGHNRSLNHRATTPTGDTVLSAPPRYLMSSLMEEATQYSSKLFEMSTRGKEVVLEGLLKDRDQIWNDPHRGPLTHLLTRATVYALGFSGAVTIFPPEPTTPHQVGEIVLGAVSKSLGLDAQVQKKVRDAFLPELSKIPSQDQMLAYPQKVARLILNVVEKNVPAPRRGPAAFPDWQRGQTAFPEQ